MKVESYVAGQVPVRDWRAIPNQVYRHDPLWIPPFIDDEDAELKADHAFLNYGQQRFFLVYGGNQPLARGLAAINGQREDRLGTLGLFETLNDEAGAALIEAACQWLREQSCEAVLGPMNRSIWHGYRFRTGGFDQAPFYGEPYNPPSYPKLFENEGFKTLKRFTSFTFKIGEELREQVDQDRRMENRLLKRGYSFSDMNLDRFDVELRELYDMVSDSFSQFTAFSPISFEEFRDLYGGMRSLVRPGFVILTRNPKGEAGGFLFSVPDLSAGIRAMKGRSNWLGKLRYLLGKKPAKRMVMLFAGVKKSTSSLGLPIAVGGLGHRNALDQGLESITHALVGEDVAPSWKRWQKGERLPDVHYQLYRREL